MSGRVIVTYADQELTLPKDAPIDVPIELRVWSRANGEAAGDCTWTTTTRWRRWLRLQPKTHRRPLERIDPTTEPAVAEAAPDDPNPRRDMAETQPKRRVFPRQRVFLTWCEKCGRDNLHEPLKKDHYGSTGPCDGALHRVDYILNPNCQAAR